MVAVKPRKQNCFTNLSVLSMYHYQCYRVRGQIILTSIQMEKLKIFIYSRNESTSIIFIFQETSAPSRLAKVSFFRRFLKLVASRKLKPLTDELDLSAISTDDVEKREEILSKYRQYCEAKNAAIGFQLAKNQVNITHKF